MLTAGTAIKSTLEKLEKYNINTNNLLVLLDRQEKGSENIQASEEIKNKYDIEVYSLINISDIINYVDKIEDFKIYKDDIVQYKNQYSS